VLQFAKHESVVSVQRAFRQQFQSDPPSDNSIRRWYQQFQTKGASVKGKVEDVFVCQKKVWNEWDSLKKSVRRARRELEVSTMTVWRCCERDWIWSPVVFTWCSSCGDHNTRRADQSVARIRLPLGCVPCDQETSNTYRICVVNS
jgi:hypothetical protein